MSQRKKRPRTIDDSDDEDYSTPTQQRSRRSHESFIGRRRSRDEPSTSTDITFDGPSSSLRLTEMVDQGRFPLLSLDEPSNSTVFASQSPIVAHSSTEIWRDRQGRRLLRGPDEPSASTDYTYDRPSTSRLSHELLNPEPSTSHPRRNPPRSCRSLYGHRNVSVRDSSDSDHDEHLEDTMHQRFRSTRRQNLPMQPRVSDDDSDEDVYQNQRERDIHRRPQFARRVTTAEYRRRALRALETSDSEEDNGEIKQPEVLLGDRVCRLGDAEGHFDLRCRHCGAMGFKTIYKKDRHKRDIPYFQDPRDCICCDGGKVFVPPMKKRPEVIERLSENRKTKEQLVSYNTCFSFASIQYHKVPAAPFGLPVAKTLGPIRHFPSAALPFDPKNPRFGNYYLYMGEEAVNLRMQGFSHLDKEVVKQVQAVMEKCHPFAHTLRTMGDIIENVKKSKEDDDMVRLRIIDARRVPKALLQGSHPGLYRDPLQCGDSVAIFYSATKEQDVFPPGFVIYPRKNNKVMLPIFHWDPRINSFCYPLLFPYGEYGFRRGKLPLAEDPTDWYEQRLMDWAVKNPALAVEWDLNYTIEELRDLCANFPGDYPLRFGANDPNIEESANEDEEEEEDDDSFDQLLHEDANFHDTGNHERQQVVERGGQHYPQNLSGEINEDNDDEMADYDGDQTIRGFLHDPSLAQINLHGDVEGNDLTADQQRIDVLDATEIENYPIGDSSSVQPSMREEEEAGENEHSDSGGEINDDSDVEVPPDRQLELDPSERYEVQHRKNVTERQYALYIHQMRKTMASDRACARNRFSSSGKLGQVFLLDLATRMYQSRSSYQRQHHTDYVNSTKTKFLQALQRRAGQLGRTIGCVSTVPQSVAGSPRHLQQLYEHTVAMSRTKHGKPDCFITFTTNVNWPEIQNNLPPGDTWGDHPMLVNLTFKKKIEKMLDKVIGKRIEKNRSLRLPGQFGRVRWYSYSVEFQQRGPPHVHLVFSLKNHLKTSEEIDQVCQAELPVRDGTPEMDELRELVETFMIHRPCQGDQEAYCRQNISPDSEECRKHFPKAFNDTTKFGDTNYPELRRRNTGEHCASNPEADNRYVVPYNAELLSYFRAHVNVEVMSNLSVVKYIFKYVFKGYDRVLIEAITSMSAPDTAAMTMEGHLVYPKSVKIPPGARKQREIQAKKLLRDNGIDLIDPGGKKMLVYDEFAMVEDQRALTACEAAWDIQAFPRHGQSHTVVDLFVHGVDEEPIHYKKEEQETKKQQLLQGGEIKTRFKEWFKLNQRDEDARSLTYEQLPTKYVFRNHQWRKRKNNRLFLFGRIKSVHPRNKEVFAMRLLSTVQKGPQSFEELRTVNGVLHPTFVSAAMELGLMNNQLEWDKCLEEASTERHPVTLRRLFASILLFNFVRNPLALWEKYREHFFERNPSWTEERKEAQALYHIDSFLRAHLTSLEAYRLPGVNHAFLPSKEHLVDDSGMLEVNRAEAEEELKKYLEKLNTEQKNIFKKITESIADPDHTKPFFIQGSGGTGKTHLLKTLYYALVSKGNKVACVAHTGIAAQLFPVGCTAHRKFHIPLTVEEDMRCTVELETNEADFLGEIDVVFWDEATMSDRRILQSVHTLMCELHPENDNLLFGGVKFVFGGDWKQTLPIVPDTHGAAVVKYTMRGSDLWNKLEVLTLKENMRARFDAPFSEWLARVGMGIANIDRDNKDVREEDQQVKLEFGTIVDSEAALLTAVFGDLSGPLCVSRKRFESSAILAVDNKTTFDVNEKALRRMPGEMRTFLSVDEHHQDANFSYLDPEVYHGETPTGMPPHELNVKVGCPVILLQNINISLGLVNGTRMIVDQVTDHIIWAIPLNPSKKTPKRWPLTRTFFSPTQICRIERCFKRTQFPIRLAFSMTINKSQGQTLDRVGILLRTPCFAHGQLYVGLSRVRRSSDLFIYNYNGMYQFHLDKKAEEERKKLREEERKERKRSQKKNLKRKPKKVHSKIRESQEIATQDSSSSDEEQRIVMGTSDMDLRLYTNNVVYASAIGN